MNLNFKKMELKYALISTNYGLENIKSFHIVLDDLTMEDIEIIKNNHDLFLSTKKNIYHNTIDEVLSNGQYPTIEDCYDYYTQMDIIIPCITKQQFENQLKS